MDVLSIVKYILMAVYAVVCLILIVLVMKQNKDSENSVGTVFGASASNFYEKNKGQTREGKMKTATIVLMIVFAVLTVALGIVYVM